MANIHTNITEINCPDDSIVEQVIGYIKELFECYTIDMDRGHCELEFASRGGFPIKEMQEMTDKINYPSLYIQIVTYELPNESVEHHIYRSGKWTDKIAGKK